MSKIQFNFGSKRAVFTKVFFLLAKFFPNAYCPALNFQKAVVSTVLAKPFNLPHFHYPNETFSPYKLSL